MSQSNPVLNLHHSGLLSMPVKKDRLHLCLYARGGTSRMPGSERKYHWALMVAPKTEHENSRGIRFDAREKPQSDSSLNWVYEEVEVDVFQSVGMLLVRITIAKVEKIERVCKILRSVPIRPDIQAGWTCKSWVKEALEKLDADEEALGTRNLEWNKIADAAMGYCGDKISAHRFDGKVEFTGYDPRRPPTFDLLENKEILL